MSCEQSVKSSFKAKIYFFFFFEFSNLDLELGSFFFSFARTKAFLQDYDLLAAEILLLSYFYTVVSLYKPGPRSFY